jgi:hypothetical protein
MVRSFPLASLFTLALLLVAIHAHASDLTFTGNLRFVSAGTITVRLSNGIVIDARLPTMATPGELAAERISARYKFADRVQIACRAIRSVWDAPAARYHSLELTGIHFVRAPSAEETAQVNASLSWQVGDNLLKPVPETPKPPRATDPEGLERVREVNLARAAKMANFIADEQATRSLRRKGDTKSKQVDTVESEIAFHVDAGSRQNIRINGKPYTTVTGWIPGVNWDSGFGRELKAVFDRDCANTFELAGQEELRGRQATVYRFRTPLDGCLGLSVVGYQQYDAAQTGRVLVDETDGNVLQMEIQAVGTPPELGGGISEISSWDHVRIGDASWLLPIATDFVWITPRGETWHVAAQYRNHRHFEASADITFK